MTLRVIDEVSNWRALSGGVLVWSTSVCNVYLPPPSPVIHDVIHLYLGTRTAAVWRAVQCHPKGGCKSADSCNRQTLSICRLFRCKPHIFSCANRTVRDFGCILLWFIPKSKGTPFKVGKVSRAHFSFLTQPHVRFAQEKSVCCAVVEWLNCEFLVFFVTALHTKMSWLWRRINDR